MTNGFFRGRSFDSDSDLHQDLNQMMLAARRCLQRGATLPDLQALIEEEFALWQDHEAWEKAVGRRRDDSPRTD